ncbi:MAG: hypothetical protein SF123_19605 [Chloroflexota bacterium]|nr:hypothetical protein [Chloroflexota bacterium]
MFFRPSGDNTDMLSLVAVPQEGVLNRLPVRSMDEQFGKFAGTDLLEMSYLLGVKKNPTGAQPTTSTGRGELGGVISKAKRAIPRGVYSFGVETLDVKRLAIAPNRATATQPMNILNPPNFGGTLFSQGGQGNELIASELSKGLYASKFAALQRLNTVIWQGNPTLSQSSTGWKDIVGFDQFIGTGKVDSVDGTPLPILDSLIYDWNYQDADSTIAALEQRIVHMFMHLQDKQRRQGGGEWDGFIAMRPDLWKILCYKWPVVQYQKILDGLAGFSAARGVVDPKELTEVRINMYNNRVLPIEGQLVPVQLDEFIVEEDNGDKPGQIAADYFASDIYFIPLTALNGALPVTYIVPISWDSQVVNEVLNMANGMARSQLFISDGGRALWTFSGNRGSLEFDWWISFFLVMHTPQWAGQLRNVKYKPVYHALDADSAGSFWASQQGRSAESTIYYYDEGGTRRSW